jgi:phospholipid/cholesterol/gamma-HCH transport system ATP-binding protein
MANGFEGPMIRVEDLVTQYGDRVILNHVNLDFPTGETMVILGGSGTGKSTLLRHIMRLESAASGRIHPGRRHLHHVRRPLQSGARKDRHVVSERGAVQLDDD